ncbi:MAG: hypothetical protein HZB20_12065, partial [Chloroflexi bacterium]|nr:hypothetical protein [Chloroflexota bacterium]
MTLRQLPSVEALLRQSDDLIAAYGRPLVVDALREAIEAARATIRNGGPIPTPAQLPDAARVRLGHRLAP